MPVSLCCSWVWDTMTVHERLKAHFDQIAHDLGAVSYSYEILGD